MAQLNIIADKAYRDNLEAKASPELIALAALTPAEADVWIDANITTLADAIGMLKTLSTAVIALYPHIDIPVIPNV